MGRSRSGNAPVARRELFALVLLVTFVAALWCVFYARWTPLAWQTPLSYSSDAISVMAAAKAVASGEIVPGATKYPSSLGAPFAANWNDYPSPEELVLALTGLLARLFGVFAGVNAAVLLAHVLAALGFYLVARWLRYDRLLSFGLAVVFAFSRYAFSRGLLHVGLTFYWHILPGILVVWWCLGRSPLFARRSRAIAAVLIAVFHGAQNAYYTAMFVQLLGLTLLAQLVRRAGRGRVLAPLILIGVTVATVLLMNADTFYGRWVNPPEGEVVARDYHGLELYALKPIELLMPVVHRLQWLHHWARQSYFAKTMLIGEAGSPYLGFAGIVAFVWLGWVSFRAVARGREERAGVPSHAWFVLWIFIYSVVGGLNGLVGFALELFRGTNRYSIFILAFVLLFLLRELTRLSKGWSVAPRALLTAALLAVALFDQVPPALAFNIAAVRQQVESDRTITGAIEAKLPPRAMIFQLPVAEFPERGNIVAMGDYEHFRPYLHSQSLRFSYGSVRGRTREAWQKEIETVGMRRGVERLERYGFAAVWLNRKGYNDRGAALLEALREAGRADVLAESSDIVCVRLNPVERPVLPPEFVAGWYGFECSPEEDWRWSSGSAAIVLHHEAERERPVRMAFDLEALTPRAVLISANGDNLATLRLDADHPRLTSELPLILRPGKNIVRFETDLPAELPGSGDPRKLAFRALNFRILD